MPESAPQDALRRRDEPAAEPGRAGIIHYPSPRVRELEVRLAGMVSRGERMVAEFASNHLAAREAVEFDRRRIVESAATRLHELEQQAGGEWEALRQRHEQLLQAFERDAAALLDAYGAAARGAQDAVARAETRLDALNDGVAQLISAAADEIRRAAEAMSAARAVDTQPSIVEERPEPAHLTAPRRMSARSIAGITLALLAATAYGAYLHRETSRAQAAAAGAERAAEQMRDRLEQQLTAVSSSQHASEDALSLAAKAERMVAVMAAADARRLALIGGRAAPAASGQVLWSRSQGVLFSAARVPPSPAGQVYQLWLMTSNGVVSLGFAGPDAQGRIGATFQIPVDLTGTVTGFLLTSEPTGGGAAPGRSIVLSS